MLFRRNISVLLMTVMLMTVTGTLQAQIIRTEINPNHIKANGLVVSNKQKFVFRCDINMPGDVPQLRRFLITRLLGNEETELSLAFDKYAQGFDRATPVSAETKPLDYNIVTMGCKPKGNCHDMFTSYLCYVTRIINKPKAGVEELLPANRIECVTYDLTGNKLLAVRDVLTAEAINASGLTGLEQSTDLMIQGSNILIYKKDERGKRKAKSISLLEENSGTFTKEFSETLLQIHKKQKEAEQDFIRTSDNQVFDIVEQMPSFPGGDGSMMGWLSSNVKYPAVAEENGVQGRVIVRFVVGKDGSISNTSISRSVDPSLDKEALRVVKAMPRWIPGKQKGKPVSVWMTIPVTFQLQ